MLLIILYVLCLWGPPSLLLNEQPGNETDNLAPSSAKVKNEWNYTSIPPLCLHGMEGDNLTFSDRLSYQCHSLRNRLKILNDIFARFHLSINNFDLLLAAASLFVLHTKYLVDNSKMVVMGRT